MHSSVCSHTKNEQSHHPLLIDYQTSEQNTAQHWIGVQKAQSSFHNGVGEEAEEKKTILESWYNTKRSIPTVFHFLDLNYCQDVISDLWNTAYAVERVFFQPWWRKEELNYSVQEGINSYWWIPVVRGKLMESSSCMFSSWLQFLQTQIFILFFPSKMHKIWCMHFTCMFAYIFFMKQLNFLSILWIFLHLASCKRARSVSAECHCTLSYAQFFRHREKEEKGIKQWRRDPQEKWGAAYKREQTCAPWVTCQLLSEDLVLLLQLPISQKANPIKQKILVLQQLQQGKPGILPCGQAAATSTTKERTKALNWKCKERSRIYHFGSKLCESWHSTVLWDRHFLSKPEEAVGVSAMSSCWTRRNKETCKDQSGQEGYLLWFIHIYCKNVFKKLWSSDWLTCILNETVI